jgi:hypothetical protein
MAHAVVEGNLGHPAKTAGCAHHHGRLGIGDEVLHLCALVGGVQRQEHMAAAQRGQVEHHGFDRLFHLHRNAAALGQIQRGQQIGHACTALLQIGPGVVEAGAIGLDGLHGDFRQIRRKRSAQRAEKIGLRHVGHRDAVELGNGESKRSMAIIGPALAWPVAPGTEKSLLQNGAPAKGAPQGSQPAQESIFTFAALTTWAQRWISLCTMAANCGWLSWP